MQSDCALFLPLISQQTQARAEGYFRREWKLAVERTHDMAAGNAFIVPVVIDDTREAGASVPDEFLRYQWTRLAHGVPSPQFVEQIKRLLEAPRNAATEPHAAPVAASAPRQKPGVPLWAAAALGVALLALVAYVLLSGPKAAAPTAKSVAAVTPAADASSVAPAKQDKSIAVLPFVNLTDNAENAAFFADGMHEDVLTNLANIAELRVISRTSVMEYRDTPKKIPQIARELGVAYVLEGSVRRAGNQVRITGQLIRGANDEHLWAKSYDRDLTARDIFSIQAALSTEIASALRAALSPETKKLLERRPTENLAAYDLYLKARQLRNTRGNLEPQETFLRAAVALDPAFAAAWAELCTVYANIYRNGRDRTAEMLAQAKAAMDTALRLAPDLPEVVFAVGQYYYYGIRDFSRATEQFERVARLQPSSSDASSMLGALHRRTGRWAEAMAALRKSVELDPSNFFAATRLTHLLQGGRRYAEAKTEWQRIAAQYPVRLDAPFNAALNSFWTSGSPREVDAFFAGLTAAQADSAAAARLKQQWAQMTGHLAELVRLEKSSKSGNAAGINAAIAQRAQGDLAGARAKLEDPAQLRSRLERAPADEALWLLLSKTEALLGHADEALRCARKAAELAAESPDTRSGPSVNANLAFVHAWTGDKDSAIAEYARLLRTPYSGLNVHEMKRNPTFLPLHGDPRFEALLNDPKNNAPLF
jgi:TolB-like protein/cytochrome c-type biogenesis protein CcmH/NrfG